MQTYEEAIGSIPTVDEVCQEPEAFLETLSSAASSARKATKSVDEEADPDEEGSDADESSDRDKLLSGLIQEQTLAMKTPSGDRPVLPGRSAVEILPEDMTERDHRLAKSARLVNKYIGAVALTLTARMAPEGGWDITDPASAAEIIKTQANVTNQVIMTGMPGILAPADMAQSNSLETSGSVSLNVKLMTDLFAGFAFTGPQTLRLQSALKSIGGAIQQADISWSKKKQTLDHCINCYYLGEIEGAASMRVPYYRTFYMHVGQSAYKAKCETVWSVSTESSGFSWVDQIYEVDEDAVQEMEAGIKNFLASIRAESMKAMQQLTDPTISVTGTEKSGTDA